MSKEKNPVADMIVDKILRSMPRLVINNIYLQAVCQDENFDQTSFIGATNGKAPEEAMRELVWQWVHSKIYKVIHKEFSAAQAAQLFLTTQLPPEASEVDLWRYSEQYNLITISGPGVIEESKTICDHVSKDNANLILDAVKQYRSSYVV